MVPGCQLSPAADMRGTVKPTRWAKSGRRAPVGAPSGRIKNGLISLGSCQRTCRSLPVTGSKGAIVKIATEAVVRSAPDGYTLLMIGGPTYGKTSRDIAPVAGIINQPYVMVGNPSFPTKTIPAFIAYAKAYPGQINMGSAGIGTPNHLLGELFKTMTGVNMFHVPYRGGAPPITDLIGGQIQVLFVGMTNAIEYIKAGTVRALGVTTPARSAALPDIPSVRVRIGL
jgi:tripartite-type tricarboxylate transporter receptor subunit TctC